MMTRNDLARLYKEHSAVLYGFLLSYTTDVADAKDLLQETFVKLARQAEKLPPLHSERSFLLKVCYRVMIDHSRRTQTRARYEDGFSKETSNLFISADPDSAALDRELSSAWAELPEDQRNVTYLKLWQEMTFEEIATLLEISPNTAASRYRYGIDKLRTLLRSLYEELKP